VEREYVRTSGMRICKWMGPTRLVTNILQNIFFWVQQKKETHTRLEQLKR